MESSMGLLKLSFSVIIILIIVFGIVVSEPPCSRPSCVEVPIDITVYQKEIKVNALENERKLCILCYPGQKKTWYRLWINPKITVNLTDPNQQLEIYHGPNVSAVVENSKATGFLSWPSFSLLKEEYVFNPFNFSCIGIASNKGYIIQFQLKNVEVNFLIYLLAGLLLFFFASTWSRNTLLHYSTGISFGVLGSILIVVFVISKFLPQKLKFLGYGIAIISTSTSLYLWKFFTVYLNDILINHWQILISYVIVAGLVSFAVVYRYGPVTNSRTLDLVKWCLQGLGLVLIYHGTQISEMSIAIIILVFSIYFLPKGFFVWLKRFRYRFFPPKTRLLTEEEYYLEGEIETKKALEELREYCRSPNCDAWKTVSRLNSPNRFASFIQRNAHLSDQELEDYNHSAALMPVDLRDDSSDSEVSISEGYR
ncbi:unnamed protein product [Lymnaea stagnalis]|uniref:Nuclear envelope integral membrane protein 1 n=1 Tax=Lymnaea stagnalis TaxID=6523 RepID=A0AAV2HHH2_LYMST